jgi:tetratricopeptide (TPR) repeat protein
MFQLRPENHNSILNRKANMQTPSNYIFVRMFIVIFAMTAAATDGFAAGTDKIRFARGGETGEVSEMTPLEITINKGQPGSHTVPVNTIKSIAFEAEPSELAQGRTNALSGSFAKAQQLLSKVDATKITRDFIKQDLEFYQAFVAAKLAETGDGEIVDAGKKLDTFVKSFPNNYHYLEASELMGELLMISGRFENAQKQYAELAKAPWPDYKMRAAVATGRALQAENKHAEAIQQFDSALALPDDGPDAQPQKLAATLGKATSLAETGKAGDAAAMIEKIIQDADPQQKDLHARAYNALGACYEKGNKTKDALFAFLHVDVLYSTVPDAHAEALYHLISLWKAVGQDDRAREARETLQQKYPASRWTKQLQ